LVRGESLLAWSLIRRLIEEHLRRPPLYERVPTVLRDLTQHELGALVMISRGLANDQIAKALVVSEATVKTHVNRI
jgi:DNA-binding NarL/FixJ family response regulator